MEVGLLAIRNSYNSTILQWQPSVQATIRKGRGEERSELKIDHEGRKNDTEFEYRKKTKLLIFYSILRLVHGLFDKIST
jgi:hypothetical protein